MCHWDANSPSVNLPVMHSKELRIVVLLIGDFSPERSFSILNSTVADLSQNMLPAAEGKRPQITSSA